jgi:hypothetical protein
MTNKRKLDIAILLSLVLFILLHKAGIELIQREIASIGEVLIWISHVLKVAFLILLLRQYGNSFDNAPATRKVLLTVGAIPFFIVSCSMTMMSGRIILNASRPTNPNRLINNPGMLSELSNLADDMLTQPRVFWVGNGVDHFIFSIKYSDGDFNFSSQNIPSEFDFSKPVGAEDMSKAVHFDSPFLENSLQISDQRVVDANEYAFCKRASRIIRKHGFDNIKLYPEHSIVQYQIYDFLGWDNGCYHVYYYCPDSNLPSEYKFSKQHNPQWFFNREPRFKK